MKRILLLNNIPAPYFDPLFARLGQEPDWSLTVCYTSIWNTNAGWVECPITNASHRTIILDQLFPRLTRWISRETAAALALLGELRRMQPDYVISYGYTLLPQLVAIVWSALTRTPIAVIGDANIYCDRAVGVRRALKNIWLRWIVHQAAALIYIGTANRMFWERYGARRDQLFEARYAVDNDYFASAVIAERENAAALRKRLGLEGKVIFLFVGRLIKRKNVALLISAIRKFSDESIALVIVGDGEERKFLEVEDARVVFTGAITQSELPRYYALADALVLPAIDEPWGLVINEAMAAGLAVIAHQHCGAAIDLVEADNGVLLKTFAVDEIGAALQTIARDTDLRRAMQLRSRTKIAAWTIEGAARGIINAVAQSLEKRAVSRTATAIEEVE